MPKNTPLETSNPQSIETAWAQGDELGATWAIVQKYARVLDMTDSGRDIKPLATGMFEAIDRLKALQATEGAKANSPLADLLAEADALLVHA